MSNGQICHYYVDEAGDPTLFDKKGKVLIGTEGCSRFFMLGLLQVDEPESLASDLTALRQDLIADPYFAGVPSMQPDGQKTYVAFHAKDDLPEVRKEVFGLLRKRTDLRFFGVIRDKEQLLSYVRQKNAEDPTYHYDPNELYDYLVRRLFRDRLHKYDTYRINIAKRGSSDRTKALQLALRAAQDRFTAKNGLPAIHPPLEVMPAFSKDMPALQAVDYFLWALQRLFERNEDRYVSLLGSAFRLVVDMDDLRSAKYGTYYDKTHPLSYAAMKDRVIDRTHIK
jgi:hypothetical protein